MTYDEVREKAFSRRHFLKGLTSCAFLWAISGNPSLTYAQEEKKGYIQTKLAYHLLPASTSFSIATAGCNLHCKFCQNWEISQARPEDTYNLRVPPEKVAAMAKKVRRRSIAYTYVEPTIFFEYMIDRAKRA